MKNLITVAALAAILANLPQDAYIVGNDDLTEVSGDHLQDCYGVVDAKLLPDPDDESLGDKKFVYLLGSMQTVGESLDELENES